ncbi:helix-turn-helix domain-containing protein [Eilatimonas milleporae]|nr:helix-turn-helix transcriptional regulator [Eilatimonas milleporae]
MARVDKFTEVRARKPLGHILQEARLTKGWSRKELSKRTGVGENSIVRYEKAGIEEGGQYPQAYKLALICHHLGVSAAEAMWSMLPEKEYDARSWEDSEYLENHPHHAFLQEQYVQMLEDIHFLKHVTRLALDEEYPLYEGEYEWFKEEALRKINRLDAWEDRQAVLGMIHFEFGGAVFPGPTADDHWLHDIRDGTSSEFMKHAHILKGLRAKEVLEGALEKLKKLSPYLFREKEPKETGLAANSLGSDASKPTKDTGGADG